MWKLVGWWVAGTGPGKTNKLNSEHNSQHAKLQATTTTCCIVSGALCQLLLLQLLVVAAVAVGVAMVFMQICSAPQNPHNVSVLFISLLAGAPIHRFLALFLNA